MTDRISLDKFCDILSKMNMDFTDFVLEDWESIEVGTPHGSPKRKILVDT